MNRGRHISNHAIRIASQIDHTSSHGRTGINRNFIDRRLDDLTVIHRDNQVIGRILNQERLTDIAHTLRRRRFHATHTAGRTALEHGEILTPHALGIAALGDNHDFTAGFLPLHRNDGVTLTKRNTLDAAGLTAHRPDITHRISRAIPVPGRDHHIVLFLDHHSRAHFIAFVQLDDKQTTGPNMRQSRHHQTLGHALLGNDHQIPVFSIRTFGDHTGHLLAILQLGQHTHQCRTAGRPTGLCHLIRLHGVHPAKVRKEDQIGQHRRRNHIFDIIITQSCHMAALAALLLQTERTGLHPLEITEIGTNNHTRLVFNQIFHRQIRIIDLMLCLPVIRIFLADLTQFSLDLLEQSSRIVQQTFATLNLSFLLLLLILQLLTLQTCQAAQTKIQNRLCLHFRQTKPVHQLSASCIRIRLRSNQINDFIDMVNSQQ